MKHQPTTSSYSIYNEDFKNREQVNPFVDIFPTLPDKKYSIIYADPPWHYNGKMQFDRSGKSKYNPGWKRGTQFQVMSAVRLRSEQTRLLPYK